MAGLNLDITANANDVLKELSRVRGEIGKLGDQQQRQAAKAKSFGKDLMGGLALGAAARFAVAEFEDAEKTARKMDAAIEATGNSAHVSAEEQRKLGDELGKVAAVDNDVVIAAGNRLRMYKNIKDEQFGETLAASLDIAAAKEKDLSVVTEQLGKALNNPLKAGKMLRSLGIELTAQQEQQIKAFVAAGDAAKAQGVILDEVSKRYGGAAAANATDTQKMKVAAADAAESVGGVLAPALGFAADGAQLTASAFGAMPKPIQTGVVLLGAAAFAAEKLDGKFGKMRTSLGQNVGELGKLDTALAVAGTGLAAFGATTAALEGVAEFHGDISNLTRDLEDFGKGTADLPTVLGNAGTSVDDLADSIKKGTDVSGGDVLKSFMGPFGDGTYGIGIRKAQEELKGFDKALTAMAQNGNAKDAEATYLKLVEALRKQGVSYKQITEAFPKYHEEQERANRNQKDTTESTKEAVAVQEGSITKLGNATNAWRDHADQVARANKETRDSIGIAQGALGASTDYQSAVLSTKDAADALAEARKGGDPDEIRRAELNLTSAIQRQTEAADKLYQAQADVNGATYDGAQSAAVIRQEYEKARKTTGYWSDDLQHAADQIEWFGGEHKVNLDTSEAKKGLWELIQLGQIATGQNPGASPGGQPVVPPTRDPDAGPRSGGRSLTRGGGVTVNLNVNNLHTGPGKRAVDSMAATAGAKAARAIMVATG